MKSRPESALLLLLFLLPLLCAQSARTPFTITGRVAQPDDSPAARAVVSISNHTGLERQIYADDAGRFEIRDLPYGRFYLTAVNPAAPNQVSNPVMVELGGSSGNVVNADIYLRIREARASVEKKKPGVVTLGEEKQGAPKPARKEFERALKLRTEKEYDRSLESFNRAIGLFPAYFQALTERGHLLVSMGSLAEALKDFEHALKLNARYGPALRGAGTCKFQLGKYAEAVPDLERAAEVEPGNPTNYYFMGIAGVALDRREQARAALLKALSLDPVSSARAHVHLATLCIRENRPQEAIREIESYLAAVPNPPDKEKIHTLLAQLRTGVKASP